MGKGRAVYGLIKEENDKSLFRVDLWTTGTTWATPSCLFFSKAPWWNHIPKNKACSKVTADRKYKLDLSLTRAGRLTSYKFRLSISVQFRANQSKWTAWHKLLLAVMLSEPNYLHWVNEHQFWGGSLRLRNTPASWRKKKKRAAVVFSSASHFPTPHHADASLYVEPSPPQTFCSWITPTCQRLDNVRLPK